MSCNTHHLLYKPVSLTVTEIWHIDFNHKPASLTVTEIWHIDFNHKPASLTVTEIWQIDRFQGQFDLDLISQGHQKYGTLTHKPYIHISQAYT